MTWNKFINVWKKSRTEMESTLKRIPVKEARNKILTHKKILKTIKSIHTILKDSRMK